MPSQQGIGSEAERDDSVGVPDAVDLKAEQTSSCSRMVRSMEFRSTSNESDSTTETRMSVLLGRMTFGGR